MKVTTSKTLIGDTLYYIARDKGGTVRFRELTEGALEASIAKHNEEERKEAERLAKQAKREQEDAESSRKKKIGLWKAGGLKRKSDGKDD